MTESEGQYVVEIDNIANGGDGVGRLPDGKAVFVPMTLPGELVRVRITRSKKTYAFGEIVEIVEASDERVDSDCQYFDRCGGCQFWHTSYDVEFRLKKKAALETVQRIAGWDEMPERILDYPAPSPLGYRERATVHLDEGDVGFYEKRSHEVIDVKHCPVLHRELNPALSALRHHQGLHGRKLDVLIETDGRGGWAATSDRHEFEIGSEDVLAKAAVAFGPEDVAVPPARFRQSGSVLNRRLAGIVAAHVKKSSKVLELFCGMGNLTVSLAKQADKVLGVEVDEEAVRAGAKIMAALELDVEMRYGELPDGLDELLSEFQPDVVVLDPPRTGARETCQLLAEAEISKIVYVACDPACFGRDVADLAQGGWQVQSMDVVDMFPRTTHMELVAVLERPTP